METRYIFINANESDLVKETEKAVLISVHVQWNYGKMITRDIWFPKSVIKKEDGQFGAAEWFVNKKESECTFKGYRMNMTSWMIGDKYMAN